MKRKSEERGSDEVEKQHFSLKANKEGLIRFELEEGIELIFETDRTGRGTVYFFSENSAAEAERLTSEWAKPENKAKLRELIQLFGPYKKVVDVETGIAHRVPTEDIITKGLRYAELKKYPVWRE